MTIKVVSLRADNSGCSFYRIKEPARVINESGSEFSVTVDTGIDVVALRDAETQMTTVTEVKTDADLIVIQRPLNQYFTSMIRQAQKQGIVCIVELDDDFENVHRKNTVWSNMQPDLHPHSNYKWVHQSCDIADWVTVSTPGLLRYAPHGRASIVRNYLPASAVSTHELQAAQGPVRVGWTGTTQTHPTDLQVVGAGVNQALRDSGSSLAIVGDGKGVRDALHVAKSIPMTTSGWVPNDEYFDALMGSMDIGLVPLEDNLFNRSKSSIKGLEYAACGIPFVASPQLEYRRLSWRGIGETAATPSDWRLLTTRLIKHDDRRLTVAAAYRELVRKHYVLEDHVEEWLTAWRSAMKCRPAS